MKKRNLILSAFVMLGMMGAQAQDATVKVDVSKPGSKINKEIYGQFAEHLGSCIYGGLWVGEDSQIPNINGYRKDVFEALKALQIPVLRWPGGCFADDYHWRDGIGPRSERPSLRNNNWGGTIEDNSFGTHEFLNLCEMLGCEPYISGNVGSGTVEEMVKWVEYMNSEEGTPMADLRKKNGRDKAWGVKYFGIGNEAWGCGGSMRPEYYSDLFRRYGEYLRNYDGHNLFKIASGASDVDYNWTKTLMENIGNRMHGTSMHFYVVTTWNGNKGQALKFNNDDFYWTLGKATLMDELINNHDRVMNETDPEKKIGLMVDEWGTWWDVEDGTNPGHLYQQNCMRDAFVAALTLNIFHKHADRVKMANIAQVVNVLQSMILTDTKGEGHMVLTPTYHVFNMYKGFQEATSLPVQLTCATMDVRNDFTQPLSEKNKAVLPMASASAAKKADGTIILSLVNVDIDKAQEFSVDLGKIAAKNVSGTILTAKDIHAYNDFSHPNDVKPADFKDAKIKNGVVSVKIPSKSIVVLEVK